jgi:Inner membrane component of T3SS, periplasmic domain/Inner membrane component of T3SS, cytoplasmic domain
MSTIDTSTKEASRQLTDSASHVTLEVIGGVHEGVLMPLAKSVYSVGSRPGVDIMLGDRGIAPEHGIVRLNGSAVFIEAAGGEIGLGKRRIPHGHGCRAMLPVDLTFGTAVVRITRAQPGHGRWRSGRVVFRGSALAGLGFAVLVPLSGLDTDAAIGRLSFAAAPGSGVWPFQFVEGHPRTATDAKGTVAAGAPAGSRVDPDVVANALSTKLQDAGLANLTTRMDGIRAVVSGAISHEQTGTWSEVQRWFDRSYGAHFILASTVEARAPNGLPKFDLQAISYSDAPYVITGDGQRRYPGAILDQGWVIKDIAAGRLTLIKDGKELALSF